MMIRNSINSLLLVVLLLVQENFVTPINVSKISQISTKENETSSTAGTGMNDLQWRQDDISDGKNQSAMFNDSTSEDSISLTSINPDFFSTRSRNTDTELSDLLDIPTKPHDTSEEKLIVPSSREIHYGKVDLSIISLDDRSDTEDVLRDPNKKISNVIDDSGESDADEDSNPPVHFAVVQGKLAVILAGIFVMICIVGYGALLSWRRFLENRYGNSQMLVNDDDNNQKEDLKYFSI